MRRDISNHLDQQGTGIGSGKRFQFSIITLRHAASHPLNFDHVQSLKPSPHCIQE
jgi:hypothetical protein